MFSVPAWSDEDRERLNIIKKAIALGTYQINPHDVATKLLLSMLEFGDDVIMLQKSSFSKDEGGGPPHGEGKA